MCATRPIIASASVRPAMVLSAIIVPALIVAAAILFPLRKAQQHFAARSSQTSFAAAGRPTVRRRQGRPRVTLQRFGGSEKQAPVAAASTEEAKAAPGALPSVHPTPHHASVPDMGDCAIVRCPALPPPDRLAAACDTPPVATPAHAIAEAPKPPPKLA